MLAMEHRLGETVKGIAVTAAPVLIIALLQVLFAPEILVLGWGVYLDDGSWATSALREDLIKIYVLSFGAIAAYWLTMGLAAQAPFFDLRWPNRLLGLSISIFLAMMVIVTITTGLDVARAACPFFGISDDYEFGFDSLSPCDRIAAPATYLITFGLPLFLGLASAVLRLFQAFRCRKALD